jgi:hypothetical protein
MFIINYFKSLLFKKNKVKISLTNEDRMNIVDPDWKDDVARKKSFYKIGMVILLSSCLVVWFLVLAIYLECTPLQLMEKIFHHIVPHYAGTGVDIIK